MAIGKINHFKSGACHHVAGKCLTLEAKTKGISGEN
jgi:hypothetical protein